VVIVNINELEKEIREVTKENAFDVNYIVEEIKKQKEIISPTASCANPF
jgi:hypothetical protein